MPADAPAAKRARSEPEGDVDDDSEYEYHTETVLIDFPSMRHFADVGWAEDCHLAERVRFVNAGGTEPIMLILSQSQPADSHCGAGGADRDHHPLWKPVISSGASVPTTAGAKVAMAFRGSWSGGHRQRQNRTDQVVVHIEKEVPPPTNLPVDSRSSTAGTSEAQGRAGGLASSASSTVGASTQEKAAAAAASSGGGVAAGDAAVVPSLFPKKERSVARSDSAFLQMKRKYGGSALHRQRTTVVAGGGGPELVDGLHASHIIPVGTTMTMRRFI